MAGNRTELMDIKQIIALKLKGVSNRKNRCSAFDKQKHH